MSKVYICIMLKKPTNNKYGQLVLSWTGSSSKYLVTPPWVMWTWLCACWSHQQSWTSCSFSRYPKQTAIVHHKSLDQPQLWEASTRHLFDLNRTEVLICYRSDWKKRLYFIFKFGMGHSQEQEPLENCPACCNSENALHLVQLVHCNWCNLHALATLHYIFKITFSGQSQGR